MATYYEASDKISISRLDIRILAALLKSRMGSYELARQCEADDKHESPISHGALYPALRSLVVMQLVDKKGHNYEISSLGKDILNSEVAGLKKITKLVDERLTS